MRDALLGAAALIDSAQPKFNSPRRTACHWAACRCLLTQTCHKTNRNRNALECVLGLALGGRGKQRSNDETYLKEENVAEMLRVFFASDAGTTMRENKHR